MRHLMNVGDEHLVRVEIQVEGDGTDAVWGAWRTEVAQFGAAWPLEVQLEPTLLVEGAYDRHSGLGEIALQQCEFLSLHRGARVRIL